MKGFEFANLTGKNCWKSKLLVTVSVTGLLVFAPYKNSTFGIDISANAQNITEANLFDDVKPTEDDQLLLESDDLTYDNDRELVIATGNVQIAYGKFSLVADKVEYNQQSGRMTAYGNVEILEPNGNRIYASEIDVTDDFKDGFVSALNVETADNTRIAAESAGRSDGKTTHFKNGVYTACKPCAENPSKPPFWQIRARTITINEETKSIEYEKPSFEFFGVPILTLPKFSHADPAVKRRTGFLLPSVGESSELGAYGRAGYFMNLAPNYDLTAYGTYYSRQGFLGELEWRHRVENGEYSIKYAGINQNDPNAFKPDTVDFRQNDRQAVITSGKFDINSKWAFGWNALYQTDNNFGRTYDIENGNARDIVNDIYLTGLGDKNYFDLRAQDFLVQDNQIDNNNDASDGINSYDDQQSTVLPSFDYNAVTGEEFAYGQIALNLNMASIHRDSFQIDNFDGAINTSANERFTGIEGNTNRFSGEIEWKNSKVLAGGALATTEFSYRGDAIEQNTDQLGTVYNPLTSNESLYRSMPAASLEIRYPLIAQSGSSTHIFEPIAQVIARPDETHIGSFSNEDAQSFVFDTTNLFERDKFSGYDRVEGGTRANVGFRYSTSFDNGATLDIVAGQSFHLAGQNSYAQSYKDVTNAGEQSGLETDNSDYVASIQLDNGHGLSTGAQVRLDESNLDIERASVTASILQPDYSLSGNYTFIESQPNYRSQKDRHEITGSAGLRLDENWRLFGGLTYDIEAREVIRENAGIAYDNDCYSFSIGYSNLDGEAFGTSSESSISVSLGLRTIGGFQRSFNVDQETN